MENDSITIEISYSLENDQEVYFLRLSPEEYYDPLEPGEVLEADSVVRYWNNIDYLDENIKGMVTEIKTDIFDVKSECRVIVSDTYWNKQKYLVRERVDFLHGVETYRIIIVSLTRSDGVTYEVFRMVKIGNFFQPIEHTIEQESVDGPEILLESYSRGMDDHGMLLRKYLS